MPWAGIKEVVIDGQHMVKIPKFYIKVYYPMFGDAKGKRTILISDKPKKGFHIYPAFVKDNKVMDCFYYGAYEASMEGFPNGDKWDSSGKQRVLTGIKACSLPNVHVWNYVFNEEAKKACEARNTGTGDQAGWHLQNVYEVYAIAILMLVEYGRTDFVDVIGKGNTGKTWTTKNNTYGDDQTVKTGASDAVWRGIHELWGNVWEHYTGITTDNSGKLSILNHKMDGTMVATGIEQPSGGAKAASSNSVKAQYTDGWPITLCDKSDTGYDIKDIFCPATESAETSAQANTLGSVHDYALWRPYAAFVSTATADMRPQTSGRAHSSFFYSTNASGPFFFNINCDYAHADVGFRMAKCGTLADETAFNEGAAALPDPNPDYAVYILPHYRVRLDSGDFLGFVAYVYSIVTGVGNKIEINRGNKPLTPDFCKNFPSIQSNGSRVKDSGTFHKQKQRTATGHTYPSDWYSTTTEYYTKLDLQKLDNALENGENKKIITDSIKKKYENGNTYSTVLLNTPLVDLTGEGSDRSYIISGDGTLNITALARQERWWVTYGDTSSVKGSPQSNFWYYSLDKTNKSFDINAVPPVSIFQ